MKKLKIIFILIPLFCLYYFASKGEIYLGALIASLTYLPLYIALDIEKLKFPKKIQDLLGILLLTSIVVIAFAAVQHLLSGGLTDGSSEYYENMGAWW